MRRNVSGILLTALVLSGLTALWFVGQGHADKPAALDVDKINKKIDSFTLTDTAGKPWSLKDHAESKAVVVVFMSFECPVSNSYAPVLANLHKNFSSKGVTFLGIVPGDDITAADLAKQAAEFKFPFAVCKDTKFRVADLFKAKISPEAFVLDHNHVLRYRGRIDNTWSARLKRSPRTTDNDLHDALTAVLAGKSPKTPATKAIGCPIVRETVAKKDGKVTYNRDVLPILQTHCQGCHRPGEVGPFSLMTYKQAVNWAQDIKEYTQDRKMPPWKIVAGQSFHNERRLTDKELKTLADWADSGTPEGDEKDAPKPVVFTDGWQLGKPDLVLTVPEEMTIGASGKDLFRCFVFPTQLTEDKYVVAVEVRPGNSRVVHHSLNFFDTSGDARRLELKEKNRKKGPNEQDHGPGYSVAMGIGFTPKAGQFGGIGGWAPGQRARYLPEGYGYPLPKGSDVVIQIHYHRNGRVEKDRTTIGLYFAKKPGIKPYKNAVIRGNFLWIPAGNDKFIARGGTEVLQDGELRSIMPHMHMIGRGIKVTMIPPGEKPRTLLTIKDWDYNWQETYFLKQAIPFKKGTKFEVEALYDNSEKNPNNPFSPPRAIIFGDQTDNEMCFVFLGVTSDDKPGRFPAQRYTPTNPPKK